MLHAGYDFSHDDLSVAVGISGWANRNVSSQRNVYHLDQFVDADLAVAIAISDASCGGR